MRRIVSSFILLSIIIAQIIPFVAFGQEKNINVSDFEVTAPTEVKVNEAFDITVKALGDDKKKITTYQGTVYFDNNNSPPANVTLPFEDGYEYQLSDQGEHTFTKGFVLKKAGSYELEVYEIGTPSGDGVSKKITITAVDKDVPPA